MLDFNCKMGLFGILLLLVFGCSSEPAPCKEELCVMEGRIAQSKLIGLDSGAILAASKATLESGEVITLLGDCAFGNEPGTFIKVEYGADLPRSVKKLVHEEMLPTSIIPSRVLERRVFSDFTPAEGAVFGSPTFCFMALEESED